MDKQCSVCRKNFGIMTKGKECEGCQMFVCKDHLINTGICVKCEILMIKDRRREELEKELNGIKDELKKTQLESDEVQMEKDEKVKKIEEIEEKMVQKDKQVTKEISYFENDLKFVLEKGKIVEERYLQVSQELENVTRALSGIRKQLADEQEKDESLRKQLVIAKEKKQQYGLEIEFLSNKIARSLPVAGLEPILCNKCKNMIGSEFFPRT